MAPTHDGLRGHQKAVSKTESHRHHRNYEHDEVMELRKKLLQSAPSVAEIFEQLDRDHGVRACFVYDHRCVSVPW